MPWAKAHRLRIAYIFPLSSFSNLAMSRKHRFLGILLRGRCFCFFLISRINIEPRVKVGIHIASHCCFNPTSSLLAPSTFSLSVTSSSPFILCCLNSICLSLYLLLSIVLNSLAPLSFCSPFVKPDLIKSNYIPHRHREAEYEYSLTDATLHLWS